MKPLNRNTLRTAVVMLSALGLLAACESSSPVTDVEGPTVAPVVLPGGGTADGNRTAEFEEFEVCKDGTTATFDFSVFDRSDGSTTNGQVTLDDGECAIIARVGGMVQT